MPNWLKKVGVTYIWVCDQSWSAYLRVQKYKSLCPAVTICHPPVNRQTDTQTHRRYSNSFRMIGSATWHLVNPKLVPVAFPIVPSVGKGRPKGKDHTLDIVHLSEETLLRKRSGMARVVERFYSFTCTHTRLSTNRMNHTCLCLSSRSWSSFFTDPGGMEGWVSLKITALSKQSLPKTATWQLSQLLAAQTATPNWAIGAQESVELGTFRAASRDANHWVTESAITVVDYEEK